MLEVSVSDAAGKDLPAAQLHYLYFHAVALSQDKLSLGMVDARKRFEPAGKTKNNLS